MFETVTLNKDVKALIEEESKDNSKELNDYLDYAVEVAKEFFPMKETK